MNGVDYGLTILLGLVLCALWHRQDHASRGPDAEKASGARLGERPTEAPVVSGGTHLRLEQAPACDRASDLLSDSQNIGAKGSDGSLSGLRPSGAPAVHIYRWVRPDEGKRLAAFGWVLHHIDPRYGTWLITKEERWP